LRQHPDIYFPEEKEPNFFNKDLYEESLKFNGRNIYFHITTLDDYISLFQGAGDEPVIGEATTTYLYSQSAPASIHQFDPQAKIIILLREPVQLMYSIHSYLQNYMMEDEKDFAKALELESLRKQQLQVPEKARYPSYLFYREKSRYIDHVKRYLQYFPANQIHIIIFENLIGNKDEELGKVFDFLGVASDFQPEFMVVNPNKEKRFKLLLKIIQSQKFKRIIRMLKPMGPVYFRTRKILDKVLFKRTKRPAMDEELKCRLRAEYRSQVGELNQFLQQQQLFSGNLLDVWGYRNNDNRDLS